MFKIQGQLKEEEEIGEGPVRIIISKNFPFLSRILSSVTCDIFEIQW